MEFQHEKVKVLIFFFVSDQDFKDVLQYNNMVLKKSKMDFT